MTAGSGNVALRVPEAAIARAVVARLGLPITATSANLQGRPECTYASCVKEQLGDQIPLIVDGGATARSVATTIVDLTGGGEQLVDPAGGRDSDARDRAVPASVGLPDECRTESP